MLPEANQDFVEHRKFSRISASEIGQLLCTIPLNPEKTIDLASTDISPGGFGAIIPHYLVNSLHKGREFAHCQINLPGLDDVSVHLVELWLLKKRNGETSMRAGFEFTSAIDWLSTGLDPSVMRAADK